MRSSLNLAGILHPDKTSKELIANRIRQARYEKDISQYRLSQITGIGQSTISEIEAGLWWPMPKTLSRIGEALEVDPAKLLYGEDGTSK